MRAALVALVVVSACGGDAPVAPVRVAAVAVTAPETTLKIGAIVVATAKLTDVNGSVLTGRALSWNSADETVASVSSTGAIKAVGLGMTTINAVSEGVSGGIALVVVPPPVASVAVTVVDHTQPSAAVQAFVTLRDADGNVLTGRPVGWTSSAPLVAAVSSTGVVSGVGPGVATITATSEDVSGSASVSVPAVASVSLNASALTLLPKQTVRLAVTLLDAAAAPATNRIASWSSSAPNVASISDSGVVTALQIGTSSVTVTTEGKSATAIVNVVAPPVTNISLSLSDASLVPVAISSPARAGTAIRIFALLSDSAGGRLPGRRDITWSSSDSVVGAIVAADSQSAVLTIGYGPLPVTITASLDGRAASAVLGVPYTPGSITLSLAGAPAKIITGDTARLALSILTPPRISSAVVWTSSNRNAAMVDSTGKITAIGLGATSISARSVVDATAVASLDLMVRSVLT
ncbi:MAG: Ig domain protein group 2 domain protein, partial [Gemmatimonadetes bacterium]|nr:Ig domain protein group 2 domain protein [Gemmatimonadota bacterium]